MIDNTANVNVWNCKEDFVTFKSLSPTNIQANIQTIGDGALPSGIGDVPVIFKDNNHVKHNLRLKNVFYFPNSQVNLISVAELANLFPDDEGMPDEDRTFIVSFRSRSTLTWKRG